MLIYSGLQSSLIASCTHIVKLIVFLDICSFILSLRMSDWSFSTWDEQSEEAMWSEVFGIFFDVLLTQICLLQSSHWVQYILSSVTSEMRRQKHLNVFMWIIHMVFKVLWSLHVKSICFCAYLSIVQELTCGSCEAKWGSYTIWNLAVDNLWMVFKVLWSCHLPFFYPVDVFLDNSCGIGSWSDIGILVHCFQSYLDSSLCIPIWCHMVGIPSSLANILACCMTAWCVC